MRTIKRIFPVICMMLVTVILSQTIYMNIMESEREQCWQELATTTETMKDEVTTKFKDEVVKLHLFENIMIKTNSYSPADIDAMYIDIVRPATIFSRIDVLYPDKTLVSNGTEIALENDINFDEIIKKGEYLTSRKFDKKLQGECVYYVLPVMKNDKFHAVIIGVIDVKKLVDEFKPIIYNGEANFCLVDTEDGNYIMDTWHKELGNVYALGDRERLEGYENVDWESEIRNQRTGRIAFKSKTTGKPLYMYYTPLGMFDWEITLFVQEDILFKNSQALQKKFLMVGVVEAFLLLIYLIWNLLNVKRLEENYKELERQKQLFEDLSFRDMLTGMNNNTKYTKDFTDLLGKELTNVGVLYIDLNGLKKINDTMLHEMGDRYIFKTGELIQGVFGNECYRVGGDEFVVMSTKYDKDEFDRKKNELISIAEKEKISISIGCVWEAESDDLTGIVKKAEEEMYREKKIYHESKKEE